ncbi:MAG: 16S rRNA (uracil(1498)-N(3))-methyltransferase [Lacipirellulaceae bacterium]
MPTLLRRCYSSRPVVDRAVTIEGQEAHHLLHVLRVQTGDSLTVFDGSGQEFQCEVAECRRAEVVLEVLSLDEVNRELPFLLELGVAMPKGDRSRWLVEKCVELGVSRLVPLSTKFWDVKAKRDSHKKLHRYVIEASKQCGRNQLMEIENLTSFEVWIQSSQEEKTTQLIAHPGGELIENAIVVQGGPIRLTIGPEGGFSEAEIEIAQRSGWRVVDLGPRILRVETAALKLISAITG